ncbi:MULTISPECIES: hypothetical protein [unclassified Mesorhizobium]|uniref:hypothetical protein n=1 Tax=unclassified Mesorhizobium TaxID=325217 RepID=UPI002417843F|nr:MULTISPECIES: hypothetical protein [unclassified Mesorhizobium]MDG4900574.1 hypothetical protein [Mesorhizobium sp. WSM4962]MDG4917189.1 hypothetical protein [Mesorhizobium sp. WSM4989]
MLAHRQGVADSDELVVLTKALNDYCKKHGIADGNERDEIAKHIMTLFMEGIIKPAELADGLDNWLAEAFKRRR